jgi:hypothetical protein
VVFVNLPMSKEQYALEVNTNRMEFEFVSDGFNGKIRKAIIYTPRNINGFMFYNLGFGDLNTETGEIDDLSTTNNGDRDRVLATVAATVLEFTNNFPGAVVYAEGSTPARTRLYQMALAKNLSEIEMSLLVYGYKGGSWLEFQRVVNYEAFAVLRR